MNESLQAELQRIGDAAPDVRVPAPDLWRRGRRARLRDRLLTSGAVIAVLALLGGAAWIGLGGPQRTPPTDGSSAPGVPDHIYDIPARLTASTDGSWPGGLESDLAIGRGAVAFVAGTAVPVVITADGAYHLLHLPDLTYANSARSTAWESGRWVCLNPDGTRLAYALPPTAEPPGIGVVDLESGSVRRVVVGATREIDTVAWSQNGAVLAWSGRTADGQGLGFEDLSSREHAEASTHSAPRAIAVNDAGVVTLVSARKLWTFDDSDLSRGKSLRGRLPDELGATAAFSPDGGALLLGGQGTAAYQVDLGSARVSSTSVGSPGVVEPLGWVAPDVAVLFLREFGTGAGRIGLLGGSQTDDLHVVASVDPSTSSTIRSVSVATDLMRLDRPTIARPEPDWPPTVSRQVRTWVLALGALVVVLALAWRRRRSRWRALT